MFKLLISIPVVTSIVGIICDYLNKEESNNKSDFTEN